MFLTEIMKDALEKPGGARFYRCALQVNPFDYLKRYNKKTSYSDEPQYNAAIINACLDQGIEVIAVTDHYRIRTSKGLIEAAREAGLFVFPGFEAATKDGVHFLCFLDSSASVELVQSKIADCGIHDEMELSPVGKYDTREFLTECREWGAACIAAHVASEQGGLLRVLKGQTCIAAWKDRNLLACSLPGPVADAPDETRPILENKNSNYRRDRAIAVVNSQDISDPSDIGKPGASCWIKMSNVSVEALRQAFLDPESRIRLGSDPFPEDHTELVAMTWDGGFLDGGAVHFNENLNVLIGGRGTGKSTVIESLRYVLQINPLGEDAQRAHEGIVNQVLKNGTKISLLVRSHHPDRRDFLIERTVPNPPVVKDGSGSLLPFSPSDILPHIETYGQHEIAELTKSPEKLTCLLERFMEPDEGLDKRKSQIKRELERSRERIFGIRKELRDIEEQLASLPSLEETLKRYQAAKLEERLKDQSLLVKEERVLKAARGRIQPFRDILNEIHNNLPIDLAFVEEKALEELPARKTLSQLRGTIGLFQESMNRIAKEFESAIQVTEDKIDEVQSHWEERKKAVQSEYETILRDLQKSRIDGEEFLKLRRQIEDLKPLRERKKSVIRNEKEFTQQRRSLLNEWEEIKRKEFQRLERAAKKVSRQLPDRVRVRVEFAGNRKPLADLLRLQVEGRFKESLDLLRPKTDLSLISLVEASRLGADEIVKRFSLPPSQADRLAKAGEITFMQIEELDLPSTVYIELNVSPEGQPPDWKALDGLSKGQKATAVLLLLLLESDVPLIVDQPEDDLDNRFITEGIVPKMREEKRRRQFLFATHNANIPVLGDAELILGLNAVGEAGMGRAEIASEHMGSIDNEPVRELVEEILEGGKTAFEMRRLKYGF